MGFALTEMTFTDITSYGAGYVPSFYFGRQMFCKIITGKEKTDGELLPYFFPAGLEATNLHDSSPAAYINKVRTICFSFFFLSHFCRFPPFLPRP